MKKVHEEQSLSYRISELKTPFILFSEDKIISNLDKFKKSLDLFWPNYKIAYSVKTNPLIGICRIFYNKGCWLEVTSLHELKIANIINKEAQIIYNGIYKEFSDTELSLVTSGIINLDGWNQLEKIMSIPEKVKDYTIGLRLVPAFQNEQIVWDKFGVEIGKHNLNSIIEMVRQARDLGIIISCLHCHAGTNISDSSTYYELSSLLAYTMNMFESSGLKIKYLDVGGGFISTESSTVIDQYIEKIVAGLKKAKINSDTTLIIEPGRGLIENAAALYTTVIDIRQKSDKYYAIVDCGVNMIMGLDLVGQRVVTPLNRKTRHCNKYDIFGILCAQGDIFAKDVILPELEVGDVLIIHNTGAYDISTSYAFSFLRPPIYLSHPDGSISILRYSETSNHIFELELNQYGNYIPPTTS